jgi:hypothetical protein
VVEYPDVPHVIRSCEGCGRAMRIVERGKHGKGIQIRKGDSFVIPAGWLKLSANPLKSTGRLTHAGLDWFAQLIFVDGLLSKESEYSTDAARIEEDVDRIVNNSPLVHPLEVNNAEDTEQILVNLQDKQYTPEFWAFWTGQFLALAREARANGEVERACWATACAERCRAMLVFKEHLEEVVWMGHSAGRIVEVLRTWDANREHNDEEFWQLTFNEHSYVLSQVFAVPVVFLQEKAYVGGMRVDRNDAKFVDYLFSAESSREAILIEIKTPVTRLLGSRYRKGTYAPSAELAGATVQILSYRAELVRNLRVLTDVSDTELQAFRPKCVLIAGNAEAQLKDEDMRRSFELFRASSEVEIVTYDELFRKVEILAQLFSLKRTPPDKQ